MLFRTLRSFSQITAHVEGVRDVLYRNWTHECRHYNTWDHERHRRLAILRLVNKAFCHSASPRMFRHIIARYHSTRKDLALFRLREISNSPYAINVCQIDIGFPAFQNQRPDTVTTRTYVDDLAGLLSSCLVRFPNLRSLEFHEPPLSLRQEQRQVYINTVITALRYVSLLNLVELEVHFPIAFDFRNFFSGGTSPLHMPLGGILGRLRHLGLYVCAYTDTPDQRYSRELVLPEHAAYPNTIHLLNLFHMVELATNLESLAISSTDFLDFNYFKLPPQVRLKSLYINGVSIASDRLLALIGQSKDSIRYIELRHVQLSSGIWQHVLLEMSNLPSLLNIAIKFSGYSISGSSSDWNPRLFPPIDDPEDIESCNFLDKFALGNVQRHVNANRLAARLPPFSDYEYPHIKLSSLETMLEILQSTPN